MNAETFIEFIKNGDKINFWKCKKPCMTVGFSYRAYPAQNVYRGTDDEENVVNCYSVPGENEYNSACYFVHVDDIIVTNEDPNNMADFHNGQLSVLVFRKDEYDDYGISVISLETLADCFEQIGDYRNVLMYVIVSQS